MKKEIYASHDEAKSLCSSCENCIADCASNPTWGNGIGEDNVLTCDEYVPRTGDLPDHVTIEID